MSAAYDRTSKMSERLTLHVCHIDGGPPPHACKRAQRAPRDGGHEFDKAIACRDRLFGLLTKGRRPELRHLSGQEKLPVVVLADGAVINGSATSSHIIAGARENSSR